MNKILVFAVHPDDETLGCGGTLLKHKKDGDEINWLIATEPKENSGFSKIEIEKRQGYINKVQKYYNFNSISKLGLSTTKVDQYSYNTIIEKIYKIISKIKPNIIYLPFKGDVHTDHRIIFDSAYSCTKSFRHPYIKKIYMMETISETEFSPNFSENYFVPNTFVDISDYIESKIDIMKIYKEEIGLHPFPRSEKNIRALATYRGATSGCFYAESFVLIKEIK